MKKTKVKKSRDTVPFSRGNSDKQVTEDEKYSVGSWKLIYDFTQHFYF